MKTVETIGTNVRYLRRRRGYTQEQLANELDMSPAYLRRIERGTANPTINILERLSKPLKTNVPSLVAPMQKDLPILYYPFRQQLFHPDIGFYPTYGIRALVQNEAGEEETIASIDDVAVDLSTAEKIAYLCNYHQVSIVHFREVVEDLLVL